MAFVRGAVAVGLIAQGLIGGAGVLRAGGVIKGGLTVHVNVWVKLGFCQAVS